MAISFTLLDFKETGLPHKFMKKPLTKRKSLGKTLNLRYQKQEAEQRQEAQSASDRVLESFSLSFLFRSLIHPEIFAGIVE